jgi:hypothetical protein
MTGASNQCHELSADSIGPFFNILDKKFAHTMKSVPFDYHPNPQLSCGREDSSPHPTISSNITSILLQRVSLCGIRQCHNHMLAEIGAQVDATMAHGTISMSLEQ